MMNQNQPQPSKIVVSISLGLLCLVVLHAFSLATAQRAIPHVERALLQQMIDDYPEHGGGICFDNRSSDAKPMNALPVNTAARDEVKRGGQVPQCQPCNQRPSPVQPKPAPVNPTAITAKPTTPKYSVSLFVLHNDPQSQRVLSWFNSDPQFRKLRERCDYQVYTRDNPLYKARYASQIPPSEFPAIMFLDSTGGSVWFVSRNQIPFEPRLAYAELSDAYKLHKEITTTAKRPNDIDLAAKFIRLTDYSPNDQEDCADGTCKPKPKEPFWKRPNDTDELFPRKPDANIEGFLFNLIARPLEMGLAMLLVLCSLVIGLVYYLKRGFS